MNKNATVVLPIEALNRELDGKLLLACHLLNSGYRVLIGSRPAVYRELKFIDNIIYLSKSISQPLVPIFKQIQNKKGKIIVLDEEGGIEHPHLVEDIIKNYIPSSMIKYIDQYYCICKYLSDSIIKYATELDENKVFITGNPRFDLLSEKYRDFYKSRIKKNQNQYGNYILINTNFSGGNHFEGVEACKKYIKSLKDVEPKLLEQTLKLIDWEIDVVKAYIETIKFIATHFKSRYIIVRPHPGESLDTYKYELNDYKNVIIRNDDTSINWIFGASLVIHYKCTTGIEAMMAGKPVISFTPLKDDSMIGPLPLLASDVVETKDDLVDKIEFYTNNPEKFVISDENKKILEYNFNNIIEPSAPVISGLVDKLYLDIHFNKEKRQNHQLKKYYLRTRNRLGFLKNRIRFLLNKNDIVIHKFRGLKKSMVSHRMKSLVHLSKMNYSYKIKSAGKNAFFICPSNK